MPAPDSVVPHLIELGFSPLEASVYVEMLRDSPRTGYQVAKAIGKPVANTYKAVEALRLRGAVLTDAREPRLCRAVPIDDVLAQCERVFTQHRDRAAAAARRLRARPSAAHTFRLASAAQVLEHARQMIDAATSVVMIDAFPELLERLRENLERAAARGVRVAALVYEPVELRGVEAVLHTRPTDVRTRWPGGWLNVVSDSAHDLVSVFAADDSLIDGIASDDVFLSLVHECGIFHELLSSKLTRLIEANAAASELKRVIRGMERFRAVRGVSSSSVSKRSPRATRARPSSKKSGG